MATKLINGIRYNLTAEEEAERNADITAWNNGEFDRRMDSLREKRNALLVQSDWAVLPDSPLSDSDKTAWETYRTDLRDLTDGLTTVDEVKAVVFPTKPS